MKAKIILVSIVMGVIIAVWLSGSASADTSTGLVKPVVNVIQSYSGSLTIGGDVDEEGVMNFGDLPAQGEPATKILTLNVTANANWQITVTTTQNLTDANTGDTISPDMFTFTSSGCLGPTYMTLDTQFRTGDHTQEDEVTVNVVTDGSDTDSCDVNVVYRLVVPETQAEGYYSAGNHVYTLIVGE